jgi:hypothetical protein
MYHYFNIIKDTPFTEDEINTAVNLSTIGLLEDETKYITFENVDGHHVLTVELHRQLEEVEADDLCRRLRISLQQTRIKRLCRIEVSNNDAYGRNIRMATISLKHTVTCGTTKTKHWTKQNTVVEKYH